MREIKFRVFDKCHKSMHIVGEDTHDSLACYDGIVQYYNLQNGEGSGEHGDYILMQYTGLKDKNGREIYEGDIVKWTRISYTDCSRKEVEETAEFIGEIKWCDTIWGIYLSNGVGHLLMPYFLETDEFEVIGNICEHAKLLEN